MEEDIIKELFSGYDPELSSRAAFMERLERNLDSVELIHRENAAVMKRNRMAVGIASAAGFITGVILTLLFPYLNGLIQTMTGDIMGAFRIPDILYGIHTISWLLIGGISVFVALHTYAISTSLLSRDTAVGTSLRH